MKNLKYMTLLNVEESRIFITQVYQKVIKSAYRMISVANVPLEGADGIS
ncbi:MAG: hypothetical protein UT01_C0011G0015 [Candidatus Daviesbacteria bacterium GW2011_GWA1_38_7]|nr:MAG: hypothetical protein UT01_C0011G0015 [Candidatus Daviesbacteria bacterium GW2011_GWA1_38_7]